jgi:hypothetical protein
MTNDMTPAECRAEALRLMDEADRNHDYPNDQKHLMRKAKVHATLSTSATPVPFTPNEAAQLANLLSHNAAILETASAREEALFSRALSFFATVARS